MPVYFKCKHCQMYGAKQCAESKSERVLYCDSCERFSVQRIPTPGASKLYTVTTNDFPVKYVVIAHSKEEAIKLVLTDHDGLFSHLSWVADEIDLSKGNTGVLLTSIDSK